MSSRLLEAYRLGIQPPFEGEVFDYAANIDLQKGYATKGNFDIRISKYLIAPMRALRDPAIRQVNVLKGIQTGGSMAMADLFVPFAMEHAPGDMLWLFAQGNDFAEQYAAERVLPLYRTIPSLKPLLAAAGRFGVTTNAIMLPHMSVLIGGLNDGNIHGLSKRYVIVDECWLAVKEKAGLIDKAKGRTKAFPKTSKIILISQGGMKNSDWGTECAECDQHNWAWQCEACKKHQIFEFSVKREDGSYAGMRWEENSFTKPNGQWNYTEAGKTARLECLHCGHQTDDTPASRRRLDDTHVYIRASNGADTSIVGYQWPSIAKPDISFSSIVTRYLKAKRQEQDHGHLLPLIQWHQQELAVNWDSEPTFSYKQLTSAAYEITSDWKDEAHRFMTVDVQRDFREFWFVIRAWAANGESRQLDRGKLESWDEVAATQKKWGVKDQSTFIDCGYEQMQVCAEAVKHGHAGWITVGGRKRQVWRCWIVLKGSKQETFLHQAGKTTERRIYSNLEYINPGLGKSGSTYLCPFFQFSALHVTDILRRHRDGEAAKWLCLTDADDPIDPLSFTAQMHSHVRIKERDDNGNLVSRWIPVSMGGEGKFNKKRPGHLFDCEKEQIVAALIHGIIGGSQEEETNNA